jgi:hypothetical protein
VITVNGEVVAEALTLEEKVDFIAWLHAEQRWEYMELVNRVTNVARVVAQIVAQQQAPMIQQQVEDQILNAMLTGGVVTHLPET